MMGAGLVWQYLSIALLPVLGRLGRSGIIQLKLFKQFTFLCIGIIYGLLYGCHDAALLLFAVANLAFESLHPAPVSMGNINAGHGLPEDYAFLAYRACLSVAFLPLIFFGYPAWSMLALIAYWPLAAYVGTTMPAIKILKLNDAWAWREAIMPLLMGVTLWLQAAL